MMIHLFTFPFFRRTTMIGFKRFYI